MSMQLEAAVGQDIVDLVRETIEAAVKRERGLSRGDLEALMDRHGMLAEPTGAFVTIYVDRQLRGCLGEVAPEDELINVLVRCASRVPLYDYRFPQVQTDELARLTFTVSVLTQPEPLTDIDSIVIGRDGLIVRHGGRSGLLLPEVPVEYHWDVETFLKHLWLKAGIDTDVPLDQVRLWRFSSRVVSGEMLSRVPGDRHSSE